MNIAYFRVSKEDETIQDLDRQIDVVEHFFNVKFNKVYKERGSAYDLKKIQKRTEFFELIKDLFHNYNIEYLFNGRYTKWEEINLYIWDYDRIMRNIQLNTLFIVLCDLFNVTIYSYKDGKTIKKKDETPSETFARYMLNSVHAFTGEQYSYTISTNTKKSVVKKNGVTASNKGKKWGRSFTTTKGKRIILSVEEAENIQKYIHDLISRYERRNAFGYYPLIIKDVAQKYKIKISRSYLTKLKNG